MIQASDASILIAELRAAEHIVVISIPKMSMPAWISGRITSSPKVLPEMESRPSVPECYEINGRTSIAGTYLLT